MPEFAVGIDRLCAQCNAPAWDKVYCPECISFKNFSDTNRAWCDGIHRGDWHAAGDGTPAEWSPVNAVSPGTARGGA